MTDWIRRHIAAVICRMKGHDVVNESYANTDSAADEYYCRRDCGWEISHTYY